MAYIEKRYFGIFHKSNSSAYEPNPLKIFAIDYDVDLGRWVDYSKWREAERALEVYNAGNVSGIGYFVFKRTDQYGNPYDKMKIKDRVEDVVVIDDDTVIKEKDVRWPEPDDQMGENCPLAYGGYWIIDDGDPSPRFFRKCDAALYAKRMFRAVSAIKEIRTTRPDVCPTIGVCPKWCYDRGFAGDLVGPGCRYTSRWPRHEGVSNSFFEKAHGVTIPEIDP
jgi:hypothetical protein